MRFPWFIIMKDIHCTYRTYIYYNHSLCTPYSCQVLLSCIVLSVHRTYIHTPSDKIAADPAIVPLSPPRLSICLSIPPTFFFCRWRLQTTPLSSALSWTVNHNTYTHTYSPAALLTPLPLPYPTSSLSSQRWPLVRAFSFSCFSPFPPHFLEVTYYKL